MAKLTDKKKTKKTYPSLYGSHTSMINEELTKQVEPDKVVCEDAGGTYTTLRRMLDNGLADKNRYAGRNSWNIK